MWANVLATVLHLCLQIFVSKHQRVNQALGDAVTEFCFHNLVCKCVLHWHILRSGLNLALKIPVIVKYLSFQHETNCTDVSGKVQRLFWLVCFTNKIRMLFTRGDAPSGDAFWS